MIGRHDEERRRWPITQTADDVAEQPVRRRDRLRLRTCRCSPTPTPAVVPVQARCRDVLEVMLTVRQVVRPGSSGISQVEHVEAGPLDGRDGRHEVLAGDQRAGHPTCRRRLDASAS